LTLAQNIHLLTLSKASSSCLEKWQGFDSGKRRPNQGRGERLKAEREDQTRGGMRA